MSSKITLLLVALVAIVACVQAQPPRPHHSVQPEKGFVTQDAHSIYRIIGGNEIDISDVPHQVSVQYSNYHFCGGSVLNNKWILTAAHCTRGKQISQLKVRLGSSQPDIGGTLVGIKRIFEHPKYNDSTIYYDFSLMELEMELTFSDVVQPVALPEQDVPEVAGTIATVSGWETSHDSAESCAILRAVNVPIVSQAECRYVYSVDNITDRMLCARYHPVGKDICSKNCGSPLVANGKMVGVVSWGFFCGLPDLPVVYGRVAHVRHWIRNTSGV